MQTATIAEKPRNQAISGRFWAGHTYSRRIKDDHKIEPAKRKGGFLLRIAGKLIPLPPAALQKNGGFYVQLPLPGA